MEHAGADHRDAVFIGSFAFFTSHFSGVYLYGLKRVHRSVNGFRMLLALSGIFSGIFVVTANA